MNREPFYEQDGVTVFLGDCLDVMRGMPDNCIDSIVTDPPYDLTGKSGKGGFMNKTWDASGIAFNPEVWREALRVAKPGATLMAFGGSRTHHRLACAIEDADDFKLTEPYDLNILLGEKDKITYNLKRALLESIDGGSYQYISEGYLTKRQIVDKNTGITQEGIQDSRTFEGWKYESL